MHIAVFCGSSLPRNKEIVDAAAVLGRRIAQEGHTLVYGGSNLGLMGVVSSAALEAGGEVVGIIPTLFSEEIIQSQRVTELVRVASMAERKELILKRCDAFIALPGGIGTIDEVSEVMVMNQLGKFCGHAPITKPMILLNINGFYDAFLEQLRLIHDEGLMRTSGGLVAANTVDEALCHIS